jgi:tetratricopeptide (TPR) repeat protein
VAYNLGTTYLNVPGLRDLDQAERWYRRSLELTDETDDLGRARAAGQLGRVAYERFREARAAGAPDQELLGHLNAAADLEQTALDLTPADQLHDRAVIHSVLGAVYGDGGMVTVALQHYQKAAKNYEDIDDRYGAGTTRCNMAIALAGANRLDDALVYARAALRDLRGLLPVAAAEVEAAQQLVALVEKARAERAR